MHAVLRDAAAGAVAGTVATVPMSAVMWAAQQLGLIPHQPPEQMTEAALDSVGAELPEPQEDRLSLLNHLLFGAAAGAVFGPLRRLLPGGGQASTDIAGGVGYGVLVWASAYQGWVPALGIMPPADEDHPGRPQSMLVAHLVFGGVLGYLVRRLRA